MNEQAIWYLENIDVKAIFCPQKMDRGDMEHHPHKVYEKGAYIYMPEEFADKVFFITEGQVKIGAFSDGGKEITKAILNPGEVFGELAMVGENTRRDFAQAMTDLSVCMLTVDAIKSLLRNHSGLGLFLMRIMGSRQLEMEQRLQSMVFKDSRSRIVEFIHELGIKKGQRVGYEMLVRTVYTHQEIANFTATSRQTVTTVLNELRTKNLITFNRKRLLIRDMEALKKEIGPF